MKKKSNNRELKSNETLNGNNIVVIWPSLKSKNQMAGKLDTQGLELPKGWSPGMVCSLCCCPLALYINGCPGEERDDVFSVNEQEWFTNSLKESVRRTLINEYFYTQAEGDGVCAGAGYGPMTGWSCEEAGDGTEDCTVECSSIVPGGIGGDNELENIGIKGRSNKGGTSDRDERELVRMRERVGIHGERVGSADEMSRNGRLRETKLNEEKRHWCSCPGFEGPQNCYHPCNDGCCANGTPTNPPSKTTGGGGIKTYGQSSKVKIRPQAEPQINEMEPNGKEDIMRKKNRMRSASNAVGELKEYTRNRTNIERFLNEDKEDKPKGKRKGSTPRPSDKAMMNMTKKVLGGVTPSTGMNNWWCCLVACNNPGCKGDRWEVVMNPWG